MPLSLLKAHLPRTPSQISKGIGVILKASFEVPAAPSAGGVCVLHPGCPLPQDGSVLMPSLCWEHCILFTSRILITVAPRVTS